MSGFSPEWLALREPADAAARSLELTRQIAGVCAAHDVVRVLDLGAGTGSNARFLGARLGGRQEWLLIDNDADLLTRAGRPSCVADLNELSPEWFTDRHLVTASALLDLVSEAWLHQLVDQCARARANTLFVLNYDGRITYSPADDEDEAVRSLVNEHQRRDKGFGPALGPESPARADALLRERGYQVSRARSDWLVGADQQALQQELIAGWARAAAEQAPSRAARIDAWRARRAAHVGAGTSRLLVGHEDVAAIPG